MTHEREFTGRHMLLITVSAFAVIIGVNVTLAVKAVKTFPGLEVKNSYVASQVFDENRIAQEALGWDVGAVIDGEELIFSVRDAEGNPVELATLDATFGRATSVKDDQTPAFEFVNGDYVAAVTVSRGNWNLRVKATAPDGTLFQQRIVIWVK